MRILTSPAFNATAATVESALNNLRDALKSDDGDRIKKALENLEQNAYKMGEEIYKGICQGCHMPDAKGATGAGAYPALAKDANLETAGYPVGVVVKGQKAMPAFAEYFTDEQIANVVNYVRTHFGNKYRDKVKPEDVKIMR